MAQLQPEEILKVLEDQAREDDALDADAMAIARMSDAELDAALAEYGVTPAMVGKSVEALLQGAGMALDPDPPPAPAPPSPQEPAPPAPIEQPGPVEQAPPIAQSGPVQQPTPAPTRASELRRRAAVALDQGRPAECLRLLDQAREQDAAGDVAPAMRRLRQRAQAALEDKPPK